MKLTTQLGLILAGVILVSCLVSCDTLGFTSKEEVAALKQGVAAAEQAEIEARTRQRDAERIAAQAELQDMSLKAQRSTLTKMLADQTALLATADAATAPAIEASIAGLTAQLTVVKEQEAKVNAAIGAALSAASRAEEDVTAASVALERLDDEIAALAVREEEAKAKIPAAIKALGDTVGNFVPGAGAIGAQASEGIGSLMNILLGGGAIAGLAAARSKAKEAAAAKRVIGITERYGFDRITQDPATKQAAQTALAADAEAFRVFMAAKQDVIRDQRLHPQAGVMA